MLRAPLPLVTLVLAMAASLPGPATAASPVVATEPSLRPDFKRAASDYAVYCPDRSLTVTVHRAEETKVMVDGRRTREQRTVPIEPGQAVTILVRGRDRLTRHYVRCLPDDFPNWRYQRIGVQVPRWYLVTPGIRFNDPSTPFAAIFDHRGVPVWWYRAPPGRRLHDLHLVGGNLAYAEAGEKGFGTDDADAYRIIRPDGTLLRSIKTVGSPTDFHELKRIGRDYLLLSYSPREHVDLSDYGGPEDATVLDSVIQRINRRGRVVWSWNSKDHIDLAETGRWWPIVAPGTPMPDGSTVHDPTHINSVEPVGKGDLLISLRNTDAVYRIRMSDGSIKWKLGGTETERSLRVVGDPADYPLGGQHDARLWRGTLTVFDNGTDLEPPRRPRALRYEIDTERRRAILLERLRDPRVVGSGCCGNARKLASGDWVINWGGPTGVSTVMTPRQRVISRLTFDDFFFSYRTRPARPGAISAASLRAGMDALYAAGEAD